MKLLVVDTETTGLSARYHRLLTIGLLPVEIDSDRLEILGSKHIFVKPDMHTVDPMALRVNKINLAEHNKQAVEPKIACNDVNTFLEEHGLTKTPVLGHNIAFDRGFIDALFTRAEQRHTFHHETVDTMHVWRRLKNQGKVPFELRSNLGTVADYFKIDYTKAHDALEDCHITAKVYQKMVGLM